MLPIKELPLICLILVIGLAKGQHDIYEELYEILDLQAILELKENDYIDNSDIKEMPEESQDLIKIAGGGSAAITDNPYLVQIRVTNSTLLCGGFILSTTWVMTAASCIVNNTAASLTVRAGTALLDSGGSVFNVSQIVKHSSYNVTTNDYDFALLQLSSNMTFTDSMKAITIPNQDQGLPLLGPITLAGWGVVSESSTAYSLNLRSVNVPVVSLLLCRWIYGTTATLSDRVFCGGKLIFGGKGACLGDYGGPAVYKNVAVGIMSALVTCGNPSHPSVFSQISAVTTWVKGVTGI